jgi:hypothetical protein
MFFVERLGETGLQGRTLGELLPGRRLRMPPQDGDPVTWFPPHDLPEQLPLALVPDDRVIPGKIYPAGDDGPPFALPTYALEVVDGLYTTRLRWRGPGDDPDGPIAVFTVGLTVQMPVAPGAATPREIAQQPTARLVQRVQVDGHAEQSARVAMDLGVVERVSATSARIRHPIFEKAEFDALWLAITDPDAPAVLELSGAVRVGRRTWRQIPQFFIAGLQDEALQKAMRLTKLVPVDPVDPNQPDPVVSASPVGAEALTRTTVGPARELTTVSPVAIRIAMERTTPIEVAQPEVAAAPVDAVFAQPTGKLVMRDQLNEAFLPASERVFDATDLQWKGRKALPSEVLIDKGGVPAVITVSLPGDQAVGPFSFPVATNAYMFDVPGDLRPTTHRLLLRHEFDAGGSRPRLVYYEDTAFAHRYYYEPQQFRVPRDDALPNLPLLVIAFSDLLVKDESDTTTVRYTARLRFNAVPDLDPIVLAGLRRQLPAGPGGAAPDLSALLPDEARIRLRLPDDGADGALVDTVRTLTREALDDGFSDEIELSPTELAAVIALLQTDGVRGTLEADLVGAGHTEIPVLVSLRDAPAVPLHRAYRGPVGEGLVRVTVSNPLESPVEIVELYRSPAGAGVFAFPQSNLGVVIPAGGSMDLDYRLDPPDADVDDIEPLLRVMVRTDLHALLPKLMVNKGYAAETFDLTVTCDAAFFGQTPSGAPGPLTALLVEFEGGGADVVLAAAKPQADVKIRMPILPWLLQESGGQRYRYRVTNLHGSGEAVRPGAVGGWTDGEGGGTLTVRPVGAA